MLAPWSAKPHPGNLDHGLAELFYLVLTVPHTPEILAGPVLKQEPRHWGTGPRRHCDPPCAASPHGLALGLQSRLTTQLGTQYSHPSNAWGRMEMLTPSCPHTPAPDCPGPVCPSSSLSGACWTTLYPGLTRRLLVNANHRAPPASALHDSSWPQQPPSLPRPCAGPTALWDGCPSRASCELWDSSGQSWLHAGAWSPWPSINARG